MAPETVNAAKMSHNAVLKLSFCFSEPEGIELQILPTSKARAEQHTLSTIHSYGTTAPQPSTDGDSIESTEFQQINEVKPSSTIGGCKSRPNSRETIEQTSISDLKAEVHRKNSSESSDGAIPVIEIVPQKSEKKNERKPKKSDSYLIVSIKDEKEPSSSSFRKLYQQESSDSQENGVLTQQPSLQSVDCEQGTSNLMENDVRRHSNFTNSSLSLLPFTGAPDIKATGDLYRV